MYIDTTLYHERVSDAYVSNKLQDGTFDLRRHSSRKAHSLLVLGGAVENPLYILSHVHFLQHFVHLVDHKDLDLAEVYSLFLNQQLQATRASNNDMRWVLFQSRLLLRQRSTTVDQLHMNSVQVGLESLKFFRHLISQLSRMYNDHALKAIVFADTLQSNNHVHGSLTHSSLCLSDQVVASKSIWYSLFLNCSSSGKN